MGLEVASLNPQLLAKCLNSLLLHAMLSDTSFSGIPCLAKIDYMYMTRVPAVLSHIRHVSMNLE